MADINSTTRPYSVYMHINKRNGKAYIGITCQGVRKRLLAHLSAAERGDTESPFHRAIKKYGAKAFRSVTLESGLTEDQAYEAEIKYISQFKTVAPEGYNLCGGGRGMRTPARITADKLKKARLAYLSIPEIREKNRLRMKNMLADPVFKAMVIEKSKQSRRNNSPEVVCVDTGEVFNSCLDAAEKMASAGKTGQRACEAAKKVRMVCEHERGTAFGLVFAYKKDYDKGVLNPISRRRNNKVLVNGVDEYDSITAAYRALGLDMGSFSTCTSRVTSGKVYIFAGYTFVSSSAEKELIQKAIALVDEAKKRNKSGKKVLEAKRKPVLMDGSVSFESMSIAVEFLVSSGFDKACVAGITQCCHGRNEVAYGHSWAYESDPEGIERAIAIAKRIKGGKVPRISKKAKPVEMIGVACFFGVSYAVRHLAENGYPSASQGNIGMVCNGMRPQAYGHSWRYV